MRSTNIFFRKQSGKADNRYISLTPEAKYNAALVALYTVMNMNLPAIARAFWHLFFPHTCAGCGNDAIDHRQLLCLPCLTELPVTNFHLYAENPVQHIFRGRLPVVHATSYAYFTKGSTMQHLLHAFKYNNRKDIGTWLGHRLGEALTTSPHYIPPDALVPVPLFRSRQRKRGYNQAQILCDALATVLGTPVWDNIVIRKSPTSSQTRKNRIERWQNMEGRFEVRKGIRLEGKHLLLVDDIVTTGATLESCGRALLQAGPVTLSIATIGFATR